MSVRDVDVRSALQLAAELTMDKEAVLPIDVVALAQKLGVHAVEPREMPSEGYVGTTASGDVVIRYRSDRPKVRTRFTIAHELGHILLATVQGKSITSAAFRQEGESSAEERAVNQIAAAILMPKSRMSSLLTRCKVGWPSIRWLCREFDVSLSALTLRVLEIPGLPALWMRLPASEIDYSAMNWRLRVSREPELTFSKPIRDVAREIHQNAVRSRFSEVEAFARNQKLVLKIPSQLILGHGAPSYWCISWDSNFMQY